MSKPIIAWKMRVADERIASHRYRAFVPARALEKAGYTQRFYFGEDRLPAEETPAALIFVKSFLRADVRMATAAAARGIPVYLDLCDNLLGDPATTPELRENFLTMAQLSRGIVVTGEALKQAVQEGVGSRVPVTIISDVVERPADLTYAERQVDRARGRWAQFKRAVKRARAGLRRMAALRFNKGKTVAWFGIGGREGEFGISDLLLIREVLSAVHTETPFGLLVISNDRSQFERLIRPFPFPTAYEVWDPRCCYRRLAKCQAVILPNRLSPFSSSKSPNRALQALNAGVPVVATATPALSPLASAVILDDWENGLKRLLNDPAFARERVERGQAMIRARYSAEVSAELWSEVMGLPPCQSSGQKVPITERTKCLSPQ